MTPSGDLSSIVRAPSARPLRGTRSRSSGVGVRVFRRLAVPVVVGPLLLGGCAERRPAPGAPAAGGAQDGPFKIGAVLDVTGAGASLGVPERDTLNLLAEQ